ncbi:D-alanine--D-alanine ligase family protein [Nocardia sp. NPDC004278]
MINVPANLKSVRVAVLYGPVSEEDRVYIRNTPHEKWSLTAIMETLTESGIDAEHLDPTAPDFVERVRTFDVAYVNVHGPWGEDGRLQGLLDYLHVPYTSSGVLAGGIGADKLASKAVFNYVGIPTLRDSGLIVESAIPAFPMPAMLKAVDGGSSVGLQRVQTLTEAANAAHRFRERGFRRFFLEEFVVGRAMTVAVLGTPTGPKALPPLEVLTERDYYDEETKLGGGDGPAVTYQVPDDLASATLDAMSFGALAVYGFLECRGAIRIDYMVDAAGVAYALEVNTTPGVQRHSNLPVAARAVGIGYRELILMLLADAIENGVRPPWVVRSFVEQHRGPSPQLEAALPYIGLATLDRME